VKRFLRHNARRTGSTPAAPRAINFGGAFLCAFAALTLLCNFSTAAPNVVSAPSEPIKIDGKLDEKSWQSALTTPDFQWLKTAAKPGAPVATQGRIMADESAVYFGFRCAEPLMAKLADKPRGRDGGIFADDVVEMFVSPAGSTATFYQFAVSAANVQADFHYIEGGRIIGQPYDGVWESAVFKGADFWSAEIRIPLSAFFVTDAGDFSDTWLINLARERQPVSELTAWAPVVNRFAEPEIFPKVSGLPRKAARDDLRLTSLQASIAKTTGEGGNGALEIGLNAAPPAAGEYFLTIEDEAGKKILEKRKVAVKAGQNLLEVGDVAFPNLGEHFLKVMLSSPSGVLAAGTYFAANIVYAPLTVEITEPFYANCIFPDQKITQLAGTAKWNLPDSETKNATLRVALRLGEKIIKLDEQAGSTPSAAQRVPFKLETGELADGDYVLEVALVKAGKTLAQTATTIRKLPKPPGNYSYLDRHLNLVSDGKTIFPRTWMGNEIFMVTQALRDEMPHPNTPFINMWNVQVGVEAARLDPSAAETERRKMDVMPSQKVFDEMTKVIEANRDRKDTWFYYLSDEPEGNGYSLGYLRHQYEFLKKHDPYHPVMIVSHAPELYTSVCDIMSPDSYLGPMVSADGTRTMTTPKLVRTQQRLTLQAGNYKTAPWITPQAFSYSGWLGRLKDADFPTFTEFRNVVYDAIANGAKGVMPFIYSDHFGSIELRRGIPFIYESIARLEPFLVSAEKDIPVTVQAPDDGVDVIVKTVNGKVLVIAVNLLDREVTADITSAGLTKYKQLVGFREDTKVPLQNGKFPLKFAPYETHLLTSEPMDAGLKSVSQLTREMNAAKTALKKEGNILFGRGKEIEWDFSDSYVFEASSLHTLTDGITDALGWIDWLNKPPARVEMAFPTFVPKFRSAKIYTSTVEDMEFWIWKAGEWQKVGEVTGNKDPVINFDFGKQLSTVKIKIMMNKMHPGMKAEIYEVELYQ
jgi:hypothetical protein